MASPEVCRALPTMTWFTSSGATPLRVSDSFAAITARSMAVMSLNEPLYSAIGVRAPSRMTMSFIGGFLSFVILSRRRRVAEGRAPQDGEGSQATQLRLEEASTQLAKLE